MGSFEFKGLMRHSFFLIDDIYNEIEISNTNTLKVTEESSFKDNKVTATFTGINPGDNEILLKDANGNITETFYVQTRYPIYVEAFDGEMEAFKLSVSPITISALG